MCKASDEEKAITLVRKIERILSYRAGCGNPECSVCNGHWKEAKELILSFAEEIRREIMPDTKYTPEQINEAKDLIQEIVSLVGDGCGNMDCPICYDQHNPIVNLLLDFVEKKKHETP